MFCSHLLDTAPRRRSGVRTVLVVSSIFSAVRAHLRGMGHEESRDGGSDRALTLSQLADRLGVKCPGNCEDDTGWTRAST